MDKKPRLSISIKLAASFVFFAIVIISAIGYLSYTVSFDVMDTAIHEGIEEQSVSIEKYMDYLYGKEVDDALIHARTPYILENTLALLNNQSIDAREKLETHLDAYVRFDDRVNAMFIMDAADGRVIVATDPLDYDVQLSGDPLFMEGKFRPVISINHYCTTQKTTSSMISVPLYQNDSVVAIVAMRLDDSKFIDSVNDVGDIGYTGVVYLIDQSGVIINNRANGTDKQIVTSEGIKRGLRGETGVLEYINHEGIPVVGAYRWVPEYTILILVERDLAEVHAPMDELLKRNIIIAIPLLIILFVFIVLLTNYLTKPIKALSFGMKKIENGDYSAYIKPMYNDELGDLTLSFNQMAEKLQRTTGELESIFTSADTGIMLVDTDAKILRVNAWISERFGNVIGISMCDSFWGDDTICNECPIEMALESNAPVTVERVHIENDLKYTYLITASPVYDSNGIAIGAVLILSDITRRLQMEYELRQYSTKLETMVNDKTKHLLDKLAEIEKMNDLFVDRELVHIEKKKELSEMLEKYKCLEEEFRQMQSAMDG